MPIHDWTRLEAGDFHHFHQAWVVFLTNALNGGVLPPEYMAMAEQVTGRPIPDVVALHARPSKEDPGGVGVASAPPSARVIAKFERINYARRADRVVIRHGRGKVVAIIEIVSPGNKESRNAIRTFVEKAADILNQGVHLLIVDLFPPTPRDPQGIHKAIWDEFGDEPFDFLPDKPADPSPQERGGPPGQPALGRSWATRCRRCRSSCRKRGTSRPHWRRLTCRPGRCSRRCSRI